MRVRIIPRAGVLSGLGCDTTMVAALVPVMTHGGHRERPREPVKDEHEYQQSVGDVAGHGLDRLRPGTGSCNLAPPQLSICHPGSAVTRPRSLSDFRFLRG